jgi:hypothetical protein
MAEIESDMEISGGGTDETVRGSFSAAVLARWLEHEEFEIGAIGLSSDGKRVHVTLIKSGGGK